MADDYNNTVSPNIGSQIIATIGVGPSWTNNPGFVDVLAPYFANRGLQLISSDLSNWSFFFGGAVFITAIVQQGFSTLADAEAAAAAALHDAGFDVQGRTNVPLGGLGQLVGAYPESKDLAPQDRPPGIFDGLAKTLGLSPTTLEIGAVAIAAVVVIAIVKSGR